jgi:hypothetical protein
MDETVEERVRQVRAAAKRFQKEDAREAARKRRESPGWRSNHIESVRYISREFRSRNPLLASTAKALCAGAEGRAAALRVPFDLTAKWILHKLLAHHCEVTGLRFETSTPGSRSNFAPSIDRKIPALGYTRANCRVVIWGYNAAKASGTDEDVIRMAEALVRKKANA